jgi:hypothetical protein
VRWGFQPWVWPEVDFLPAGFIRPELHNDESLRKFNLKRPVDHLHSFLVRESREQLLHPHLVFDHAADFAVTQLKLRAGIDNG